MDTLKFIFGQPILLGFLMGLTVALIVWWGAWRRRVALQKEIARLKEFAHTQMEITERGQKDLLLENKTYKEQVENLRITLATLSQKTDKAELRKLRVYDKALHELFATMPGFATAWEAALRRADAEVEKTRRGLLPFLKEIIYPSFDSLAEHPTPQPAPAAVPAEPTQQNLTVELLPAADAPIQPEPGEPQPDEDSAPDTPTQKTEKEPD